MDLASRKDGEASSRRNGEPHPPQTPRDISSIQALQETEFPALQGERRETTLYVNSLGDSGPRVRLQTRGAEGWTPHSCEPGCEPLTAACWALQEHKACVCHSVSNDART